MERKKRVVPREVSSASENRQLHIEDYLQMVSAEQEEYAEVFDYRMITEKSSIITDYWTDNLLDLILRKDNLNKAYKRVKSNKGAGGIDGMQVDGLLPYLKENQDALIQQAITQELTPIYEEQFSENSFGFRPKRGQHDALRQCQKNVNDGYVYVVDMDLEKFFDTVCQVKYLGYTFYRYQGKCRFRVHPKSVVKMKNKIREITDRHKGISNEKREEMYQQFVRGWVEYFKHADMKGLLVLLFT